MIFNKSSKIIAAVLTAALALSPVFVTPISATDGQEVEMEASSWRYQDGEIIEEESVSALEADDPLLMEDYNAQMGSSAEEEATVAEAESAEATDAKATDPAVDPEPAAEPETEPALTGEDPQAEAASAEAGEPIIAEEPAEAPEAAAPEAAPAEPVQAEESAEAPAAEPEVAAMSATALDRYWSWNSGQTKRGLGYLKGIDVSYWQGNIDWAKVKNAGVDFAIIRCGYGSNTTSRDDSKFAANVRGCVQNGIPYGVYLYSYANTVSEANSEANHALRLLKANNCKLQYPIYYDLEDTQVSKASNATIVAMANVFCSKLSSNGYASGVYANLNWWNNKLSAFNGYDKWVAQWASKCTYGKNYSIWQCSSEASVSGISGRVDANLLMCTRATMDYFMNIKYIPPVTYSLKNIDGKLYAIGSNGDVVKNRFFKIGSYTYAFGPDGAMVAGQSYWIGNAGYILDSQGRAYINKSKTKRKAPYYAKAGSGKKGTLKKGRSFYVLRTSGKWSQMANGYWIKTSLTKKTVVYPNISPSVKVSYKAKLKKKTVSRSGPSNGYIKCKTFKKNRKVTVIGTYGSWSKISSGQWLPSSRLKR